MSDQFTNGNERPTESVTARPIPDSQLPTAHPLGAPMETVPISEFVGPPVPPSRRPRPPQLRCIIGVWVLAVLSMLTLQMLGGCVGGCTMAVANTDIEPAEIAAAFQTPMGILVTLLLAQAGVLIVALLAIRREYLPWREQIGWKRSRLPAWGYAVMCLATLFLALGGGFGAGVVHIILFGMPEVTEDVDGVEQVEGEQSDWLVDFQQTRTESTTGEFVILVLCISLVPGLVEEVFFRGYVQRRLLRRMSGISAVMWTSVLFALLHVDPRQIVFAMPLGVWFGVIAWRTGSIWPSVVCHAFINAAWNIWHRIPPTQEQPELAMAVMFLAVVLSIVALVLGLLMLLKRVPPRPAGPSVAPPPAPVMVIT